MKIKQVELWSCVFHLQSSIQGYFQGPPMMVHPFVVSVPYYSHIFGDYDGSGMGMVYGKLTINGSHHCGVPENLTDLFPTPGVAWPGPGVRVSAKGVWLEDSRCNPSERPFIWVRPISLHLSHEKAFHWILINRDPYVIVYERFPT